MPKSVNCKHTCSFCGKPRCEVDSMMAATDEPGGVICDECVVSCVRLLAAEPSRPVVRARLEQIRREVSGTGGAVHSALAINLLN